MDDEARAVAIRRLAERILADDQSARNRKRLKAIIALAQEMGK